MSAPTMLAYFTIENTVRSVVPTILFSGLAYILLLFAYRLTLHPLARYPGPFLAKITNWRLGYYAWTGDSHIDFWRLHQAYGSIVRVAPNYVLINTNTALRDIYGNGKNVMKADQYFHLRRNAKVVTTFSATDKKEHAFRRRIIAHGFSETALRAMEEDILSHVRVFCREIGNKMNGDDWSEPRNMAQWSSYLTFDILGTLSFSRSFGMLESEENRYVPELISQLGRRNNIVMMQPKFAWLKLDLLILGRIMKSIRKYRAFYGAVAKERAKRGSVESSRDFFQKIFTAKDPETRLGLSEAQVAAEASLMIIAGSDTSSVALSSTLFYLTHNPETAKRLVREVRAAFSNIEDIRPGSKLNSCQYLRACLDEAMRLSSPSSTLPRKVLSGGIQVDGHLFPENTVVGVNHYSIHHVPEYYPEPFAYKPSRWIVDPANGVTQESVDLARSAFCPFSIGPRACIARNMAYMELTLILGRIIYMYDMRISPGSTLGGGGAPKAVFGRHRKEEYQMLDWMTMVKDGPVIEFKLARRDDVSERI